jgi:hypothetical protein
MNWKGFVRKQSGNEGVAFPFYRGLWITMKYLSEGRRFPLEIRSGHLSNTSLEVSCYNNTGKIILKLKHNVPFHKNLIFDSCHMMVVDNSSKSLHMLVGCWACRLNEIVSLGGSTTSQQFLQCLPYVLLLKNHQVSVFIFAVTLCLQFKPCGNSTATARKMDVNNQTHKKSMTKLRNGEYCRRTVRLL